MARTIITEYKDEGTAINIRAHDASDRTKGGLNYFWRNECNTHEHHLGCHGFDRHDSGCVHPGNM
eukprot:7230719-Prorocentrum_lima.AAC.1